MSATGRAGALGAADADIWTASATGTAGASSWWDATIEAEAAAGMAGAYGAAAAAGTAGAYEVKPSRDSANSVLAGLVGGATSMWSALWQTDFARAAYQVATRVAVPDIATDLKFQVDEADRPGAAGDIIEDPTQAPFLWSPTTGMNYQVTDATLGADSTKVLSGMAPLRTLGGGGKGFRTIPRSALNAADPTSETGVLGKLWSIMAEAVTITNTEGKKDVRALADATKLVTMGRIFAPNKSDAKTADRAADKPGYWLGLTLNIDGSFKRGGTSHAFANAQLRLRLGVVTVAAADSKKKKYALAEDMPVFVRATLDTTHMTVGSDTNMHADTMRDALLQLFGRYGNNEVFQAAREAIIQPENVSRPPVAEMVDVDAINDKAGNKLLGRDTKGKGAPLRLPALLKYDRRIFLLTRNSNGGITTDEQAKAHLRIHDVSTGFNTVPVEADVAYGAVKDKHQSTRELGLLSVPHMRKQLLVVDFDNAGNLKGEAEDVVKVKHIRELVEELDARTTGSGEPLHGAWPKSKLDGAVLAAVWGKYTTTVATYSDFVTAGMEGVFREVHRLVPWEVNTWTTGRAAALNKRRTPAAALGGVEATAQELTQPLQGKVFAVITGLDANGGDLGFTMELVDSTRTTDGRRNTRVVQYMLPTETVANLLRTLGAQAVYEETTARDVAAIIVPDGFAEFRSSMSRQIARVSDNWTVFPLSTFIQQFLASHAEEVARLLVDSVFAADRAAELQTTIFSRLRQRQLQAMLGIGGPGSQDVFVLQGAAVTDDSTPKGARTLKGNVLLAPTPGGSTLRHNSLRLDVPELSALLRFSGYSVSAGLDAATSIDSVVRQLSSVAAVVHGADGVSPQMTAALNQFNEMRDRTGDTRVQLLSLQQFLDEAGVRRTRQAHGNSSPAEPFWRKRAAVESAIMQSIDRGAARNVQLAGVAAAGAMVGPPRRGGKAVKGRGKGKGKAAKGRGRGGGAGRGRAGAMPAREDEEGSEDEEEEAGDSAEESGEESDDNSVEGEEEDGGSAGISMGYTSEEGEEDEDEDGGAGAGRAGAFQDTDAWAGYGGAGANASADAWSWTDGDAGSVAAGAYSEAAAGGAAGAYEAADDDGQDDEDYAGGDGERDMTDIIGSMTPEQLRVVQRAIDARTKTEGRRHW